MGKKKINYYKEKRWIMAWWYKKRKELQFTDADMFSQWNKWWVCYFKKLKCNTTLKCEPRFEENDYYDLVRNNK